MIHPTPAPCAPSDTATPAAPRETWVVTGRRMADDASAFDALDAASIGAPGIGVVWLTDATVTDNATREQQTPTSEDVMPHNERDRLQAWADEIQGRAARAASSHPVAARVLAALDALRVAERQRDLALARDQIPTR